MASDMERRQAIDLIDDMLQWRCKCPCCLGVERCLAGCTDAEDCPDEHGEMVWCRQLYRAIKVAFDKES
jgi:hypothetical protein